MITLVEQKYGFSIIEKVESKKSEYVAAKTIEVMPQYKDKVKTLTFDNGLEFAEHLVIAKALECSIYFAKTLKVPGKDEQMNIQTVCSVSIFKRDILIHIPQLMLPMPWRV